MVKPDLHSTGLSRALMCIITHIVSSFEILFGGIWMQLALINDDGKPFKRKTTVPLIFKCQ